MRVWYDWFPTDHCIRSCHHSNHSAHRINFFAAGFIDTIHTWLQKKDRTPEQMAKFLLEMLVQLRS